MDNESELKKTVRRIALGETARKRALDHISRTSSLAKHVAFLDSPTLKIIRDMQNSPVFRLQREIESSALFRAQRAVENTTVFRMQKELSHLNEISSMTAIDNTIFKRLDQFKELQGFHRSDISLAQRILPPKSMLEDAARHIAAIVDPPAVRALTCAVWPKRLETLMTGMSSPWMDVNKSALSLQGLGVLASLSDTARFASPFAPETRELFDDTLGDPVDIDHDGGEEEADALHLDAGMDAGLVTLSPPETGEILQLAGFQLIVPYAPSPKPIESDLEPLHYDPSYADFVTQIERQIRSHIDFELSRLFGKKWISARVPQAMQQVWRQRRDKALQDGEPEFELIHYADFIDLKTIIIGRKTWGQVFAKRFGIKEHFVTAMDRLYAVRKPLAHGRPISNGQRLHLYLEGVQIMRALDVEILKG